MKQSCFSYYHMQDMRHRRSEVTVELRKVSQKYEARGSVKHFLSPPLESQRWTTIETSEHSCGEGWYSYYFFSLGWNCKGIATVLSLCLSLLSLSTLFSLSSESSECEPWRAVWSSTICKVCELFLSLWGQGRSKTTPMMCVNLGLCTLFKKLNVASPPVTTSCINSTNVLTAKSQPMTCARVMCPVQVTYPHVLGAKVFG